LAENIEGKLKMYPKIYLEHIKGKAHLRDLSVGGK
jgi:hypothetical protein